MVRKQDADATLVLRILEWDERSENTTGDEVSSDERVSMLVQVQLFEPYAEDTLIADLGEIRVRSIFNTDARSSRYQPEPDRKTAMMRQMADRVVERTISGFPVGLAGMPPAPAGGAPARFGGGCGVGGRAARTASGAALKRGLISQDGWGGSQWAFSSDLESTFIHNTIDARLGMVVS